MRAVKLALTWSTALFVALGLIVILSQAFDTAARMVRGITNVDSPRTSYLPWL